MPVAVATWNLNSIRARCDHVLDWLQRERPDVLAVQETKVTDEDFPEQRFTEIGYNCVYHGQPKYNGVAILSREPPRQVRMGIPGYDDPQRRALFACFEEADLALLNLYVPNGSEVGSEKYSYKMQWLEQLQRYVSDLCASHKRLAVAGDFNIAPADLDVHDPELWRDKVLCSKPEREHFQRLLDGNGMVDVFRALNPETPGYSWWDYRQAGFRRDLGLRIDHILATPGLKPLSCAVDKAPRALERPSDHAPVSASFS